MNGVGSFLLFFHKGERSWNLPNADLIYLHYDISDWFWSFWSLTCQTKKVPGELLTAKIGLFSMQFFCASWPGCHGVICRPTWGLEKYPLRILLMGWYEGVGKITWNSFSDQLLNGYCFNGWWLTQAISMLTRTLQKHIVAIMIWDAHKVPYSKLHLLLRRIVCRLECLLQQPPLLIVRRIEDL